MVPTNQKHDTVGYKGVNLLKIGLLITGQWVTDNVSIKLYKPNSEIAVKIFPKQTT